MEDSDLLYNRVIVNMRRLLKVLTGHSSAIDSLERKLRDISAPIKKPHKRRFGSRRGSPSHHADGQDMQQLAEDDDAGALGEVHELDMEDDIDLLSEGAMEREIMMDQIKSSDIFTLEEFNKYNLTVQNAKNLEINESNDLSEVSSDDSGDNEPEEDDQK